MFESSESGHIMSDQIQPPLESKPCCAPNVTRSAQSSSTLVTLSQGVASTAGLAAATEMIALPGGEFLMGTDYTGGFAADGEGPIRGVALDAFRIDATPVTNAAFAQFVNATGYVTEAESFG